MLSVLRASGFCYPQIVFTFKTRNDVKCADIYFLSEAHGKQFLANYSHYDKFSAMFSRPPFANIKVDKSTLSKLAPRKPVVPQSAMPGLLGMGLVNFPNSQGKGQWPFKR